MLDQVFKKVQGVGRYKQFTLTSKTHFRYRNIKMQGDIREKVKDIKHMN